MESWGHRNRMHGCDRLMLITNSAATNTYRQHKADLLHGLIKRALKQVLMPW